MTKPLCPNKEVCGSCSWSHIPYEEQLKLKLSALNDSLKKHLVKLSCREIIPSPVTEHYRNRMDFAIDFQGRVGLREKGKWWRVIDGHCCFLGMKKINSLFLIVRKWVKECGLSFYDRKAHKGILRYAVIRSVLKGQGLINIITSKAESEVEEREVIFALEELAKRAGDSSVIWSVNYTHSDVSFGEVKRVLSGDGFLTEDINNFIFKISPNSFFQTNPYLAQQLQVEVINLAKEAREEAGSGQAVDLYSGLGFFSIPLSRYFTVQAVESSKSAVIDGKENAVLNGAKVEFLEQEVEECLVDALRSNLVVLDPPRSGVSDKAFKVIFEAKPSVIIYISCNYKALARDLSRLCQWYTVENIKAFDMFPHTPHLETVVMMRYAG
ncbi:MAG: 23S rRNA (uracil(1939)-C(5))-methyltransferase RlmD [Candidatus Dadabacteria bacterium]|nr:MAG: 23S rRNA (uracil(1939)-C(5))-methyltransferase RlmD [Candidatus Dadabacteria bacterium]